MQSSIDFCEYFSIYFLFLTLSLIPQLILRDHTTESMMKHNFFSVFH